MTLSQKTTHKVTIPIEFEFTDEDLLFTPWDSEVPTSSYEPIEMLYTWLDSGDRELTNLIIDKFTDYIVDQMRIYHPQYLTSD